MRRRGSHGDRMTSFCSDGRGQRTHEALTGEECDEQKDRDGQEDHNDWLRPVAQEPHRADKNYEEEEAPQDEEHA